MRVTAVLVAAGRGTRAGDGPPKQFRAVAGRPAIVHAVAALTPLVDDIVLVIHPDDEALVAALPELAGLPRIHGGATRRESVARGLAAVAGDAIVLVHDAARPFLPAEVAARLVQAVEAGAAGAVPVLPVADSLVRAGVTVDRAGLMRVQTPQAFRADILRAAHAGWREAEEPTDDAAMVRALGHAVVEVAGDERLAKLTTAADFALAEARLGAALIGRTGMGFDVHRFGPGDHVWLCGVRIAHDRGLVGHSDADVGLHALVDALLGGLGDGDIGSHFPPSDPRWKGAASHLFVTHAVDLVAARGGIIDHVDLTIICEAPKVGPHRAAMRSRVAELLRVREGRVSIKASTTEKLGFTGRGEGMAAQAVATLRLPGDNL